MQLDKFESELETLVAGSKKKKLDKEVCLTYIFHGLYKVSVIINCPSTLDIFFLK